MPKLRDRNPYTWTRPEIVDDCLFLLGIAKALSTRPADLPVMDSQQLWQAFKLAVRSGRFRYPEDVPKALLDKVGCGPRLVIAVALEMDSPDPPSPKAMSDLLIAAASDDLREPESTD